MKKIFFLSCLLIPTHSFADQFKKIKSKHFDILFPVQIEQDFPRFCSDVEYMYDSVFKDFKIRKNSRYKIYITNTSVQNAYVMPQNSPLGKEKIYFINYNYFLSSYSTIFVHEMRHVAQFSYFYEPFKNPLKLLSFATYDQAMIMEGDAVLTETLLTNEGRGRDPYFLLEEKTKILNNDNASYAQFLYRDHYTVGYLFCSYFRKKYGIENFRKLFERRNLYDGLCWRKGYKNFRILVDNAIDRFYPLSVNHRLKEIAGKNFVQFFSEIKEAAREYWNRQLETIKISKFEKVNKENKSYLNPQKYKDGIIALKTSNIKLNEKAELTHYVFLKDGQEQWLKDFDFIFKANFSYAQDKIVFLGNKNKQKNKKLPKYLKEADNAIFILDNKTNKVKVIDKFPHCHNPIFSHDAKKIIFFSPNEDGTPALIVLDGDDFTILKKYELEKFHDYKSPIFSHDDKKIFFIDCFNGESQIKVIEEDEVKEVYRMKSILRGLGENKEFIFFSSPLSGIDNIYAFEKKSHQVWQVTSSKYGAYKPHVIDDALVYNNYNDECHFDIAKVKIDKDKWTPIEKVEDKNVYFFDGLQQKEGKVFTIENKEKIFDNHKVKNHRMSLGLNYVFDKESQTSERLSGDLIQDLIYKQIYDTWLGLNCDDYDSGLSLGIKYKDNTKSNIINANVGYSFYDIHNVNFETTIFSKSKDKTKFFREHILSYKPILKTTVGKSFFTLVPEMKAIMKVKKNDLSFNFLFDIYSDFSTFQSDNTTFLAFEKNNTFLRHDFKYDLDKKNSFTLGAYVFRIDFDGIKKNSEIFRILSQNNVTSCLEKVTSNKVFDQDLNDFRQIGFSLGYKYLIPLDYSLENLNDEFYCLFVKSVNVGPELKVDIPMFGKNEYSLLCKVDIKVLRSTVIHTNIGIKIAREQVSPIWPSFSIDLNLLEM
jgi:hypothetical protein